METPSVPSASQAARGGRGRSTAKKRHTLPLARSASSRPSDSTELPPTPTNDMAPSSFSYETPSPSSSRSVRGVRNRQGDAAIQSPEDPDSKGGRSLRRKPRIDYSFDHPLDDSEAFSAKATPTSSRVLKKRKTDISFLDGDADEEHEMRVKRRASEQPLAPASTRRKSAARKTTVEPQMYVPDQQGDDAEVQDTIEVGGRHSTHSDDSFRARTSSGSSHDLTPRVAHTSAITNVQEPPPPPPALITTQDEEVMNHADSSNDIAVIDHDEHGPPNQSSPPPVSHPPADPAPEFVPESVPEPASEQASEPAPEPAQLVEAVPKPISHVEHLPEPQPEPQSEPQSESHVEPPVEHETEPHPEPQPAVVQEMKEPQQKTTTAEAIIPVPVEEVEPKEQTPEAQLQTQPEVSVPTQSSSIKQEVKASDIPIPSDIPAIKLPKSSGAPAPGSRSITSAPAVAVAPVPTKDDPLAHLTPYIPGATVLFPKTKLGADGDGEADADGEHDQDAAEADVGVEPAEDAGDEAGEGADEETPIGTPLNLETAANSPAPEQDPTSTIPSRQQYAFKKTRDASEFTSLFDDIKGLSFSELYYRLEVANRAMAAWQNEFNALRAITENEDNSIRYHQEEMAFQHREKMALSKDPSANPLRKDFIVKGTRAPKPDHQTTYLRQQDKVMAQAYLFEYDDRESKIAQQDPVSQRTGAAGKARLRDRPKQTAKAAESEDPAVVSGKRARKAPTLFDGLEGASRSSTPAPSSQPKRRRRGAGQENDENGEFVPGSLGANGEPTPAKKGKGGRPRKHPLPVAAAESTPAPADSEPALPTPNIAERPVRKRRRRDLDEEDEALANGLASEASKKARRRNSRVSEIPTGSFYSQSSAYADEDNRPGTASSTATNTTADSSPNSYQLREKRQKKFSLADDEYDEFAERNDNTPARPVKRARRVPRKSYIEQVMPLPEADEYAMDLSQPEQTQPLAPKPTPKIKIKNYQPVATPVAVPPVSSPYSPAPSQTMDSPSTQTGSFRSNGNTPQTEPEENKDYSTMTKSEKMSYSMKARWASGSMSAAVSKRRATLAAKKSASAAAPPVPATEKPAMSVIQNEQSHTPVPVPQQP